MLETVEYLSDLSFQGTCYICPQIGEVAERLKAHAWKACWGQPLRGSNPRLSATRFVSHVMITRRDIEYHDKEAEGVMGIIPVPL